MKMYFKIPPSNKLIHMRGNIQHKPTRSRPSLELILESDCDVCFVPFNKIAPKKIEEGCEVLFCSQCHIHVHKSCYNFQPSLTVLSDKVSEFLCDRCSSEDLAQAKCLICQGGDGAMKKIGGKEVIHVYCGLMHNDIEVTSYYPSINFRKSTNYEDTQHSCEICHQRNAHEKCADESCRRKVHVYCAKKQYSTLLKETQEPKSWNHKISSGNQEKIDLTDQVIPYELLSEQVEVNLKSLQQIGLELPGKEQVRLKVHKQYLQQMRSRRKSTKKLRRGGFSYVLCPQHEVLSYCSCFGKADGEDMVLCQCCFEWYHHKCMKYIVSEESYICQYCKSFYDFKKKAVEEMKGGRSEYDVVRIEMPLKMSVQDCMWVMRVLDNRIRGGLAAKMLKQLYKYPLKSSCMDLLIRHQNRNKLTALTDDCLAQYSSSEQLLQALRPRVVLGVDGEGKPFTVSANIEYNGLIRKGIQVLLGMGLRGQGFTAILKELEFKERALSDQYEQIIELSKVEQNYQEVQILKQKAQAYNFIEIINKIQKNSPVSIEELQDSIAKASRSALPNYLKDILTSKYNIVAPIIEQINAAIANSPENTYQITHLVDELTNHHVLPPQHYHQLIAEKKFIQNLYLYLIKQEGNKIEEELTIQQKIAILLTCTALKPNQELIDIVTAYPPSQSLSTSALASPIWEGIDKVIEKYQNIAIDFQIKEMIKRRYCKQQKFLSIIDRATKYNNISASQEVETVLKKWKQIRADFDQINTSLETAVNFEELNHRLSLTNKVIDSIENFNIRIEQDNPNKSITTQIKSRKEELEQLRILYTQSQLQKNPLTLSKLLPTLPRANPLVKQWISLKKEQSSLMGKFTSILARINERLELFKNQKKLQRKEQIKQNCDKPSINQITELIEILKHSNIDMSREVKDLTKTINNSLEIGSKVKKYIEERGDCSQCNLDELSNRRKQIEDQRKKLLTIAQLNLKSELVQLYHLEICNRMRTSLISQGLDLEKINTLLKFAEEENLMHTPTYISLKEKYETKNQKSKEVNLIKHIQQGLATEASKDLTFNFTHLYVYRKNLSIPQVNEAKTKNPYLDELAEKNKQIREKISNALQQKPLKWDLNEARSLYLDALKNPYFQPQLNRMSVEVTKGCQLHRRWKQIGRSFNHLHPIFLDYDLLTFTIEEIEAVKKQVKMTEDEISKLNSFISNFNEGNRDQLQEILERIQGNNVIRQTDICKQAELNYLKFWTRLLQLCKDSKKITPYQKIKRLTLDAYNLLQKSLRIGEDYDQLKTIIYQLEDYLILVKNHLKSYPTYAANTCIANSFIDLEDFYLQNDDEDQDLSELIPLLKPFSDLTKFRSKNLQRLQFRREQLSLKRSRDKFQDIRAESQKQISVKEQSSQQVPQVVSENQRKKIKQIFLKNIRKNPQLKKYGQCQNQVKMIENQIFGEWHNDIVKYFLMSQEFQKLFMKLINCPNISNKIIKKKFQFKFIQILVSNLAKIDELQGMIVNKIKEVETQKTITKISQSINQKSQQMERENEAVMQSIASGKIDQSLKQDIKKEIKSLKEVKDGKHKKKKHHKHRSRSKSPQAQFSQQSQKELPSYIQNEYNKDQTKSEKKAQLIIVQSAESPLRYDPQEEQTKNKQTIYPKGALLKLKNCDLQITTKKKGRVEFPIEILTEQEHRKILSELFDPGFTRLSIRKDKSETEIIQYISKSKKKYKYLVCWFEAVRSEDNEILKDISLDANEKKKIFGWQNEHVKIHIMSVRQLVQINRFNIPARVTSISAANHLNIERVVMIIQYPEKVYQVRDQYKPFAQIERKSEEYSVSVPTLALEAPIYDFYPKYTMPTIEPLNKPVYEEPKMVYEGGWGNDGLPNVLLPQPPAQPQQLIQQPPISNIPYKVNQIRMHFGFGNFSPILSDQEDNEQNKNNGDLASDLLNSLGDFGKMPAQHPVQRQKPQPVQQQQYQGYYGGYGYQPQPPPRSIPSTGDRWMGGYSNMGQGMPPQSLQGSGQVYNPLNPMTGKFPAQQIPPISNQMYKNPMMGQRPPMGGQYYRPPNSNQGYDPRYQGGYQQ